MITNFEFRFDISILTLGEDTFHRFFYSGIAVISENNFPRTLRLTIDDWRRVPDVAHHKASSRSKKCSNGGRCKAAVGCKLLELLFHLVNDPILPD